MKEASQSGDEGAVGRITEDLLRLTIEQQASLLSSPEQLNSRVREMEQVLRRCVSVGGGGEGVCVCVCVCVILYRDCSACLIRTGISFLSSPELVPRRLS